MTCSAWWVEVVSAPYSITNVDSVAPVLFLYQFGRSFPALSHLSLCHALEPERVKPPRVTKATIHQEAEAAAVVAALFSGQKREQVESGGFHHDHAVDTDSPAASPGSDSAVDTRRAATMGMGGEREDDPAMDGDHGVPAPQLHRTSAVGWAALILGHPHGLFSLNLRNNTLAYASYALLHESVSELRATRVLSPAEESARVAALRNTVASKGGAKKTALGIGAGGQGAHSDTE